MTIVDHGFPELAMVSDNTPPGPEEEAVLRQLTLQRLLGYGVEYGDATRVRTAVAAGVPWKHACLAVADSVLGTFDQQASRRSVTGRSRCYRASALIRMSQVMMLADDGERRASYRRAAELFQRAGEVEPGWVKTFIESRGTKLVGWYLGVPGHTGHSVIVVVGGVEGWAMDFDATAQAIARRGLGVLILDGPGQGESRLEHGAYLSEHWKEDYTSVIDYVQREFRARSVGLLGNSMGGNFVIQFAGFDRRIAAFCNNGAIRMPLSQQRRSNFFPKMIAFCEGGPSAAMAIWATLEITRESLGATAPFLLIHGESDPLVSIDDSRQMLEWSASTDKEMHLFARGDHCIYDKPGDKHDLIADWFATRLLAHTN